MRTATKRNCRRRLDFEALEHRAMLSAVSIAITNGQLQILGEHLNNHVRIEGFGTEGEVEIVGIDTVLMYQGQDVGDTLFLGGAAPEEQFDSIAIDLREGNDTVEINNINKHNLSISTGAGADFVRLGAYEDYAASLEFVTADSGLVAFTGGLAIDTGPGADLIQAVRVFTAGNWNISLGDNDGTTNNTDGRAENDLATNLDDQCYIFVGAGSTISIAGGTGDDLVNINYLISHGPLSIAGGLGNDIISLNGCAFKANVGLFGESGFDTVAVDFCRHDAGAAARPALDGGADADFVFLARSLIVGGQVTMSAGLGSDHVVVGRYYANIQGDLTTGGNELGTITVDTDAGTDRVDIRGNVCDQFFGRFGGDNDDVDFINNVVRVQGLLDGSVGTDSFTFFGNLTANFGSVGFESPDNNFSPDLSIGGVTIEKTVFAPIQLSTAATTPYNILLAVAQGGNAPYTFTLESGTGFQPLGMQLVTEGNLLFLRGIPSPGSESPFERQFGVCVKDIGGNSDCVDTPFSYIVSGGASVGPGQVQVVVVGNGRITDNLGRIDTAAGDFIGHYNNEFPFLNAEPSFAHTDWLLNGISVGISGLSLAITPSDYETSGAVVTAVFG
jgi:hypothetical protein